MTTASKVTSLTTPKGNIEVVKRLQLFQRTATVCCQGAPADTLFFVRIGKVRITVVSAYGKEAVLRVLGPDDFLGEECLVPGSVRTSTATCLEPSTVFRIRSRDMLQALRIQPTLSR